MEGDMAPEGEGSGSGEGEGTGTGTGTGTGAPAPTPAIFAAPASQEELDKIVETRLNRERAKYGMTPDEVKALKDKQDKLEFDLADEHGKQLKTTEEETATKITAHFLPQLVEAKLDAAAGRKGVDAEQLQKAVEFVAFDKFLDDDGEIDPAKIDAFVAGIAPAGNANGHKIVRQLGQGTHQAAGVKPGDAGRAEAQKRFARPGQQQQ